MNSPYTSKCQRATFYRKELIMLVKDLNVIAAKNGVSIERMRKMINNTLAKSTPELENDGKNWYRSAYNDCAEIAMRTPYTVDQIAGAVAHLSPRMPWSRNIELAKTLATTGTAPCMKRSLDNAIAALNSNDPMETFGKDAHKTRAFYQNIMNNHQMVTVDVWAARIAIGTKDAEKMLSRKGMYQAVAHAYKLAAKDNNVSPAEAQAIAWCVIRGTAL